MQLKRRADLLPNLIETVKGYAAHEKAVFENVTRARAETLSAGGPAEAGVAEGHMQQALKSLFAVAEAYPALQASQNFLQLQQSIVDTEDKVQASRRFYNGGVRELNTKIKVFPNNLFARNLGFQRARVLRGRRRRRHLGAASRAVLSRPALTRERQAPSGSSGLSALSATGSPGPAACRRASGITAGEIVGRVSPARDRDVVEPLPAGGERAARRRGGPRHPPAVRAPTTPTARAAWMPRDRP